MKYIYIIFFIGLVIFSCKKKDLNEPIKEAAKENSYVIHMNTNQYKNASISEGKILSQKMSGKIQVNGKLDVPPQNLITISAIMGGYVTYTPLLQGMKIKKGSIVATLQHPDYIKIQREFLESKSKLEYLKQEFDRQEELRKENVSSIQAYQETTAQYNQLKASYADLYQRLQLIGIDPNKLTIDNISSTIQIKSPESGYVTKVFINIGKMVQPQDIICEIVNTDHLHAEFFVFEKDIHYIKINQDITFTLLNEEAARKAKVYLINHNIEEDRTIRVHAHLDKDDPLLIPNMYIKGYIQTNNKMVHVVPNQAIVSTNGKDYVFVIKNKSNTQIELEAKEIIKGISDEHYTEIIDDQINQWINQNIVIEGSYDVLSVWKNTNEEE
jgi:cobalt-zinc-cadmium efflux system membrane fusion protein